MQVDMLVLIALLTGAGSCATLAVLGFIQALKKQGSCWFALLCVCFFLYAGGYALELKSQTLEQVLFLIRIEYIGIAFLPAFWMLIVRDYGGGFRFKVPAPVFFVIPVITYTLVLLQNMHSLFYIDPVIRFQYGLTFLDFGKGPWYFVQIVYLEVALIIGTIVFLKGVITQKIYRRKQALCFLLGSLLPWLGNILYLFKLTPHGIDLSPLALVAAAPLFAWGFTRFRLHDLLPLARDSIFEQMGDALLVADALGTIVDYNKKASDLLPALTGRNDKAVITVYDVLNPFLMNKELPLPSEPPLAFQIFTDQGEKNYTVAATILLNKDGSLMGTIYRLSDISDQVALNAKLVHLASTDELTGLMNRRSFFERGRLELERARRYGRPFSVAIMDLNAFKTINDMHGHSIGDKALCLVSQLCAGALRTCDFIGRYGGDEFVFAFPETNEDDVKAVVGKLRQLVCSATVNSGTLIITLSASIGTATAFGPELPELEELLSIADKRMYFAKGRDQR